LKHTFTVAVLTLCAAFAAAQTPNTPPPTSAQVPAPVDPGWPRSFSKDGTTIVIHQPQIDSWKNYTTMRFRCAIEVTLQGASTPEMGVIAAEAETEVHTAANTVVLTDIQPAIRFPGASPEIAAALTAVVKEALPQKSTLTLSLDRVLVYMRNMTPPPGVALNMAPPPIFYSENPAILVMFMGQPDFKPIPNTKIMFAANTNWLMLMDGTTTQYYLLNNGSWMTAPDPLKGPWTAAATLPPDFSSLPKAGWEEVLKNLPGKPMATVPVVFTSTQPAELIVTQGPPSYTPISGTPLMYVNNPTMTLFYNVSNSTYYFLVAGRWFSASTLNGPWAAASASLPPAFANIPASCPLAYVLASVPGTQQAQDAILLANVPQKATVKIAEAKLDVTYVGTPQYVAIPNTQMTYAVNTPFQIVQYGGAYYCCNKGVWFIATSPTGPWVVCSVVPDVIYTIPPSCPLYNVTYVKVYSTTPDTVVVGYTSGYSGEYVAATGAVMFGAGMVTGALIAGNNSWYYGCPPSYYSYGCAPVYHYGYGTYYRGAGCYGPYGGAGWCAGYNPATGTYFRSGSAYGPYGSVHGTQAYNPWTGTYGQHTGGSNGYGSWGNSYVSQGNRWAEAGHTTNNATGVTKGWAEDSSGQWAEGAHKGDSTVAKTSNGDVYAGHDGNVYKKDDSGQWQKYDNGSWNNVNRPSQTGSMSGNQGNLGGNQGLNQTESRAAQASNSSAWQNRSQNSWQSQWGSGSGSTSDLQNRWGQGNEGGQGGWQDHDNMNGLNRDSWARGESGGGGWGGGGNGWGGGSRSWGGGGGGFGGGGFGGFGGASRFGGFHRR